MSDNVAWRLQIVKIWSYPRTLLVLQKTTSLAIMNDVLERVGRRIREARASAGLTQEQLAEKADLAVSYVGQIERGLRDPSLKALNSITDALGLDLFQVFAPDASDDAFATKLTSIAATVADDKRKDFLLAMIRIAALAK